MAGKVFSLWGAAAVLALVGCGGGGGGANGGSAGNKTSDRNRIIATTRLARHSFAIAGFALRINRSARLSMGNRVQMLLSALKLQRGVSQGQDPDTKLYYILTIQTDGSGRQDLFTDAMHKTPAGFFSWPAPQWHNNVPNTYPAIFHVTFQITAGEFAGDKGTLDVTLNDPLGKTGFIHLLLANDKKEKCDCNLNYDNGSITCQGDVTTADGTSGSETATSTSDDDIQCDITFPDGEQGTITLHPDGTGDETLTAPDGTTDATGDFQDSGSDTVNYDDGSSETVNVDTTPETPDDSSDSSDSGKAATRRPLTSPIRRR